MFKITKSFNRLALVIILAISGTISALAENKIMLGDGGTISIKPGETKEIDVNLINDVELYTAQFDMELTSSKIKIVEGSFKINEERVDRESFLAPSLVRQPDGKMRLCLLTRDLSTPIAGTEGSLGTIKIQADPTFTSNDNAKIYFSKCCGSDKNAKLTYFDAPNFQAVTPMVGTLATTENAFSIKPGEKHKVDIVMKNEIYFCGIQTDITLPAGLQIEKKENGKYKFEYSSRLSDNFSISSRDMGNGKVRLMLSSLPVDKIIPYTEGTDGVIFSFNVVADENFVTDENSAITFSNTLAANDAGVEYALDITDSKVVVTSLKVANDAAYAKLTEEVAALQKSLDDAKAKVAEECKDVAENFTETVAAIQAQIDAIKKALDEKNTAIELTEESTLDAEAVKAVNDAIAKYLEDAATAQANFEKKVANDAAYAKLSDEIAAVQARFDEVVKTIEKDYAMVAAQFAETEAGIQNDIDAVAEDLKAKADRIELDENSTVDQQAIKTAIEKLLTDAKDAYQKKIDANEAAYKRLTDEIAAIQTRFDEVKKIIDTECNLVAAQFAGIEANIQYDINKKKDELKNMYENIELDENSTLDLQTIKDAIEQLLVDAKAAQETAGIYSISALTRDGVSVYTLEGNKVDTPVKGNVYIVRYADGTIKKVFVR